ncbi:MAG: hypothetical protein PHC38_08245 [Weeksellaceae bacterium]|nr:hypothetical protein [Weeksellaceae bacterium]
MKARIHIYIYILSVMIFLSPLLAFTNIQAEYQESLMEADCCVVDAESQKEHSCCMDSDAEQPVKKCNDNRCHPSTCHLTQISVFSFYMNDYQTDEFSSFYLKKTKFDHYKSLTIENLSASSWKPPKYIS